MATSSANAFCISIHAPREGSDTVSCAYSGLRGIHFYPRSPRGERPAALPTELRRHEISIHAPREGSDLLLLPQKSSSFFISIHAPREGSDHSHLTQCQS